MPEQPDNILLAYMWKFDAKLDALAADTRDVKSRLSTVERQIGQAASNEQSHYATVMDRFDRLETRLERLERRMDLIEAGVPSAM